MTNVEVIRLRPRLLRSYSTYVGHLNPFLRVLVSSEIPGIVETANFKVGRHVERGELLVKISTKRQILNNRLNRSNYRLALDDYNREVALFDKQMSTTAKLKTLKNRLEVSKLRLDLSSLDLIKSKVAAPISGIVKSKFVERGEYVPKGRGLLELFDISKVLAIINIPERDIRFTKIGNRLSITLDALPDIATHGIIKTIGLEASKRSRSFPVEVEIDNPGERLRPGMLVRARMLRISKPNQIIIPRHTIQEEESGSFVYITRKRVTVKRKVKVGISVGNDVQVLSGLKSGDLLIVKGHQLITANERVKINSVRTQKI
jgi:membrane fusion protein (multidrug efflux system)